jgi:hypothetical protein
MTQEKMKKIGWVLIIVGAMVPVMMAAINSFDFWYIHLIILGTGYYFGLKGRGYKAFKSRHFYIMIVFSPLPIIGPILATIRLKYLPNFGEQLDPARKDHTLLASTAFVIATVIVIFLYFLKIEEERKTRRVGFDLLVSAKNHILQADILKREGKDFSVEIALAKNDIQRSREIFINEDREAQIALVSGDIFSLQARYEEAEKMYRRAEHRRPNDVKERLARLKELRKGP